MPPPMPSTPERKPAARPMPTRARVRRDTAGIVGPVDGSLARLVAPLRAQPRRGAVVCDIDGTLAPIVAAPEDARVLPEALAALEKLAPRYALVGCVTGRPAAEARTLVPIETVAISGNHGLEVWRDGAVHLAPQAEKYLPAIHEAIQVVRNDGLLPEYGCHVEDKGITFTIHFRNSPRADHARRYLETQIVPKIERAGLASSFGRMVLEVRPPVAVDKGAAVKRLRGRRHITEILFVGDDTSDLDAFREATVRIAVRSPEAPRALLAAADAVVEGPAAVIELLEHLAEPA
jgi:trehalose 6-phosphate phosphatase